MTPFRRIRTAVVETMGTVDVARHHHREGYANVVLAGSFCEAAFAGASRVEPGSVLLHAAFDAHRNTGTGRRGPSLLRLPWYDPAREGHHRVRDPDLLARLVERDAREAWEALSEMMERVPSPPPSWTDRLAAALVTAAPLRLGDWAEENGLAPETVSRGFGKVFGVSPQRFRLEARTREAWRQVCRRTSSLTEIAHAAGFADLAHMSRSVSALTGHSPTAWRRRARPGQSRSSEPPRAVPPSLE